MMEKISWTDHVRNEEVLLRVNEQRNILHEIRKGKANWIGHILRRNFLLQQVIEGQIKRQIEATRRRGRRRKKLLNDLKDGRGYCQLKEEALDRTMWRNRFGRDFGPVVWQITDDDDDDLIAFFLEWDMFHTKVAETFFFCENRALMRKGYCRKIWYSKTGHRWQFNTAHAHCVLDTWGYKHALRICNTYCFSTVTVVMRTRLNVTLYVHCPSCFFSPQNVSCSSCVSFSQSTAVTSLYIVNVSSCNGLRRRLLHLFRVQMNIIVNSIVLYSV